MEASKSGSKGDVLSEMVDTCVLMRTRLVSRAVTALYEEGLRPFGVNAPQFALLVVIHAIGPATRAEIGRYNHQERSTLTRNLQIMLSQGWIEESTDDKAGRGRPMVLTKAGTRLLRDVAPVWKEGQVEARRMLGEHGTAVVTDVANKLMHSWAAP